MHPACSIPALVLTCLPLCLPPRSISGDLAAFMQWVDQERRLKVLTNADTPEDALAAREAGAEGIGLVRTEHMFFASAQRIAAVRRMIAATELGSPAAAEALAELQKFQCNDFKGIFRWAAACTTRVLPACAACLCCLPECAALSPINGVLHPKGYFADIWHCGPVHLNVPDVATSGADPACPSCPTPAGPWTACP
jgi:hypothetical protein